MAQRKPLSKVTRFEVFKRDSFTCQYCGSKAPDTILEVDHINPISKGGDNEIMNLITSCFVCNRGKTNRVLSDNTIVEKQRLQIEELNIRRQQLEMMLQWRDENIEFKNLEAQKAIDYFNSKFTKNYLSNDGCLNFTKLVKKYGLINVLAAIDISIEKYHYGEEDCGLVYSKIGGILNIQSMPEYRQKISHIISVCKNKGFYINNAKIIKTLTAYYIFNNDLDFLLRQVKNGLIYNYTMLIEHAELCIKASNKN